MSNLNIQWRMGKPFGVFSLLAGFAILSQIPIIYHAREILGVIENDFLAAYITITIAGIFIITNAELVLYEALLIRLRSYNIKDYRAPFLSIGISMLVYYIVYYLTFVVLAGIELFGLQEPVAQYAFCQMIGLIIIMVLSLWYNRRQTKILG